MGDRVRAAQAEAQRRFRHEGRQLAPLRFWVVGVVVLVAAGMEMFVTFDICRLDPLSSTR